MQRPDMTVAVDWGVKHQFKQTNKQWFSALIWLKTKHGMQTVPSHLKPRLHLPRSSYDFSICDFPYDFLDIVGDRGL